MDADDARAAAERAAKQRNAVFEAFTRQEATPTGTGEGAPGVVRMLRSLYSTTRSVKAEGGAERMITSISTKEAARRLGVSQRTVQRWIKGQHNPSATVMKKLSTKARQAVTTKRGRAQAVRRAIANQKPTANGVRVRVSGMQGPKDYSRMRDIGQKLTPEEYEGLQHAYMEGGDKGALDFLENVLSDKYVENWNIDYLTGLGFDGVGPHDNDGDPRAFH